MRLVVSCLVAASLGCHTEHPVSEQQSAHPAPPVRSVSTDPVELVSAELLCLTDAYPSAGETVLGLHLSIEPGWHLYWRGANDTGLPLAVDWLLPPGVEVGPLQWPVPERYVSTGDLLDHVFFDELTLLATLRIPAALSVDELTVAAQLDWLVCAEACLPGERTVELSLPVRAAGAATHPGPGAALLEAALAVQPAGAPADLVVDWSVDQLRLTVPGAQGLVFYPRDDCLPLDDLIATGETTGDTLLLSRDLRMHGGTRLRGILSVRDGPGARVHSHRIDIAPPDDPP